VLGSTLSHFWPKHPSWLAGVRDTRDQDKIIYGRSFLLVMGLMLFLLKLGSRRQARFELDSPEALANLNSLSGCQQAAMAHSDTLNHFLGHVPPESLERLRWLMVHRLIRMKALEGGRLFGHFLIVIDGTGQLYFRRQHCKHCLTKTVDDKTQYFHNVLEAKLVTPEGLAISIGHEFIQNDDPKASKQDCELKAFARLAGRLKKDYPQLRMCLCMDALYATGTVMETCRLNGWRYFITFKKGSLPSLWEEYVSLLRLRPQDRTAVRTAGGPRQDFAWVGGLEHIDDRKRSHHLNAFQCLEVDGRNRTLFVWLTDFQVDAGSVAQLANRGGRCRWKIENEGFNTQKNGGFNLEHAYGLGERQIKNFYTLLQIAHMILQLMERGSLLAGECKRLFGSIRNFSRRLLESIRNRLIPAEALDAAAAAAIQIRINTS
jgi:hypothetical protein